MSRNFPTSVKVISQLKSASSLNTDLEPVNMKSSACDIEKQKVILLAYQ